MFFKRVTRLVRRVLLLMSCCTAPLTAQTSLAPLAARDATTSSWVHEAWTVKDGLPVNSINAIIQDRVGYIWAATFDGLVRFDGRRFTLFNSANSDELPSNRILALQEARDGAIWLTTEQGHVVRFRAGRFTNMTFADRHVARGAAIMIVDSTGAVWVGTREGLWTIRNDVLTRVGRGTLDAHVTALMAARDGSLWVGTNDAGVFQVAEGQRVTRVISGAALGGKLITRVAEDRTGTVWIGGDGLWSWNPQVNPQLRQMQSDSDVPLAIENFAELGTTNELFTATPSGVFRLERDGLVRVRPAHDTHGLRMWSDSVALWDVDGQRVFRDKRLVATLPDRRRISAALFDHEGSLWLGTDAGGLHRLKPALFNAYSVPEGVTHPDVYATYIDRAGAVWLGTWGGGVSRLDPVTGRATPFASRTLPKSINSFFEDRNGRLWIGSAVGEGGLHSCTVSPIVCQAEGPPELRERAVFALHGDADGGLWVGATDRLFRLDGGRWTSYLSTSGAPEASVRAFANTRDGALWMGTNGGGLARFRDGKFSSVTRADGLPSDLIRALYQDADGWLWVGTEGRGLARLDPRRWDKDRLDSDGRIVRISTQDGLFDDVIHQILEDDAGRLWMNTNRGIFWVARAELNAFADGKTSRVHSTAYSERDGIRNREGNGGVQPAGAKGLDGRLWFPMQDGVVVIDPAMVRRDQLAPSLVVEQLITGAQALVPERNSIVLLPDQRDVQIEYTALTFLEPTNVRFRYRLDPYDAAWVDVGNRRTAFYTKVPPGRYTFHVQSSDAVGGWYEPGVALAIRVRAQFWETGVFRFGMVVAFGILLLVAVRLREVRLHRRALMLEHVVDERTLALRERERELADRNAQLQSLDRAKTRFFANVSHELRTPLTLTIGPLEDLRARADGDPQVERWLEIALRNAHRLLRLVNQILDVAKLEAGAVHLAPRLLDLGPFTRGVVAAFAPVAERKGLQLSVESVPVLGGFDGDAVEKILTNLLSNAIKFTPGGGTVHVGLSQDGDCAQLVVRDTGPGIPPDQIDRVFERFYQVDGPTRTQPGTGIGLSLVKELVELHGGRIDVESGSTGTTFTATIPPRTLTVAGNAGNAGIEATPSLAAPEITAEHVAFGAESREREAPGADVPTLLIVEDSADLRGYIRTHFADRYRVMEAADGAKGIELARRHLPDVVLSDVMMPGTDGHELVRVLRSSVETDFLSIILLTAQAENQQRLEGLERGADEYLVKPFSMRELDVRVRNLMLARRRLRDRFTGQGSDVRSVADNLAENAVVTRADADTVMAPADQEYVSRIRKAINRGLSDPDFGVGELAIAVSQDRSHLFRRTKQLFGESPSNLIRRIRVAEGERLLTQGTGTVTDVAYAVGFNSLSYFCHCFQEAYGMTPAAYRARAPR